MTGLLFAILITAGYQQTQENKAVSADTTASANSVPLYAFEGAYVTYAQNNYGDRRVTFTISDVNVTAQTFKVTWSYTGTWNFTAATSSETISYATLSPFAGNSSNIPFSAANSADLQTLNRGETPADMPADAVVTANVSIFALGGYYFNTDEITLPSETNSTYGYSVFVDMRSGLMAAEDFAKNGAAWGIAWGELSLITTNIPMTANVRPSSPPSPSPPPSSIVPVVAISATLAAVVVVAVLLVYLRKRKRQS